MFTHQAYQLGGMVASRPIVMVSARNPNRKIVILAMVASSRRQFSVQA